MTHSKTTAPQSRGEDPGTKPGFGLLPLVALNKRPAPISILSSARRTALIECLNNNGLHKQKGCWRGSSDGKRVSGSTVADLSRDGMLSVTTNRLSGSAQLTDRGNWFARTLIKATDAV
jgi:hypothetical protein